MGTNAKKDLHEQRPFHIPLTQFLEEVEQKYLWLQVREVKPAGPMVLAAKHQSPPLIPYVVAEREQVEEQVSENLELWLQRFLDDRGSDWQWYVFPKLVEQAWERNILGQICYLLNPSNIEHKTLQVAMELTLFNHLLTHSFTVPDGHIEWLYNKKLQHPHYKNHTPLGVEVCPGAVNAFLAMIILHKVEVQAKLTLEHIDEPFVSRDDSMLTGTLVFCESFLFVMVLAQLQNSVLEHAKMDSNVYETTISIEEAKQLMKTMEDELATPVIELCVFKLRKVFKKRKSEASAPSNRELESSTDESMTRFFDNLHKITESCGKLSFISASTQGTKQEIATTLNKQTDLGNIHAYMFGARNVQRMLKKLYDAVSPFFAAPDPLHIALD